MTVGLVIVSHSARIAEGVVELAAQMAEGVRIVAAGGTDDGRIGTSFERVSAAIAAAQSGDGVVILCDLGSAVLTAETAVEFEADADTVRIADAPIVEGAVAAAVAALVGEDLSGVVAAAETAREARDAAEPPPTGPRQGSVVRTVTLENASGLHARPAAEFVKTASGFAAAVTVEGVDAKSLLGIMSLGATRGRRIRIEASGPDAEAAVDALSALVESGFGET